MEDKFRHDFMRLILRAGASADLLRLAGNSALAPVPLRFDSPEHYTRIMEPLLIEEALAGAQAEVEAAAAALGRGA